MKKILLVLLLGFVARLFFSCCNCPDDVTTISVNKLYINNLDNTDFYHEISPVLHDSMLRSAVAFEVILRDTSVREYPVLYGANSGFTSASAFQPCECYPNFKVKEQITSLRIISLHDVNAQYKAGSDVTGIFVGSYSEKSIYGLYRNFDDIIKAVNEQIQYGFPGIRIGVYCTKPIENDFAQFSFEVKLSNGKVMTAQSKLIQITSPGL
jgi:hypothetical protein